MNVSSSWKEPGVEQLLDALARGQLALVVLLLLGLRRRVHRRLAQLLELARASPRRSPGSSGAWGAGVYGAVHGSAAMNGRWCAVPEGVQRRREDARARRPRPSRARCGGCELGRGSRLDGDRRVRARRAGRRFGLGRAGGGTARAQKPGARRLGLRLGGAPARRLGRRRRLGRTGGARPRRRRRDPRRHHDPRPEARRLQLEPAGRPLALPFDERVRRRRPRDADLAERPRDGAPRASGSETSAHSSGPDFTSVRFASASVPRSFGHPCAQPPAACKRTPGTRCTVGDGGRSAAARADPRPQPAGQPVDARVPGRRARARSPSTTRPPARCWAAATRTPGRCRPPSGPRSYGPFDDDGEPIPFDELDLTAGAARQPARPRALLHPLRRRAPHLIEASALPIVGTGGYRGAIVVFWPAEERR